MVACTTIYVDDMTATVGSNTAEQIENFSFREVSNRPFPYVPITVMGTVAPVGFRAAHRWVEGEITVKSEAASCFVQNTTATTFTVAITKAAGGVDTYTFTGAIFSGAEFNGRHDEEGLTTYKFVATGYSKA